MGVDCKAVLQSGLLGNRASHSGAPRAPRVASTFLPTAEQRGQSPSWEGGVRRHVAWASLPGGKQSLGTRLGLRLVPPSDSGGGAAVGALRPGACHVPSLSEGLPPPPLPPALPRMEEGCCSPPGSRGALGPICTSVLANAGELAQPLPPLIPRPHSKYHGIKRKAEWTF